MRVAGSKALVNRLSVSLPVLLMSYFLLLPIPLSCCLVCGGSIIFYIALAS